MNRDNADNRLGQSPGNYHLCSADALDGIDVIGSNGEKIGDVEDAIIDRLTGKVEGLIVDLGMLSSDVVVPTRALTWRTDNDKDVVAVGMNEAELKALPPFKDAATWRAARAPERAGPGAPARREPFERADRGELSTVKGTVERVDTLSMPDGEDYMIVVVTEDGTGPRRIALAPSWYTRSTESMPFRGAVITVKGYNSQENGEPLMVASEVRDTHGRVLPYRDEQNRPAWLSSDPTDATNRTRYLTLSNLMGRDVKAQDETCGAVNDVLIERTSGEIAFISIDPNETFLGIADTKRLVPFTLAFIPAEGAVQIDATKAMILASVETPTDLKSLSAPNTFAGAYKPYGVDARRFATPSSVPDDQNTATSWDRAATLMKGAAPADRINITGVVNGVSSTLLPDGLGEVNVLRVTADGTPYDVVLGPTAKTSEYRSAVQNGETLNLTLTRVRLSGHNYWFASRYSGGSKNVTLWDDQARPTWRQK